MRLLSFLSAESQKKKHEKRRFFALENRSGISKGKVDENSNVRFYLDKGNRNEGSANVGDFEAKSAKDDFGVKFLATLPGFVLLVFIIASTYSDELGKRIALMDTVFFAVAFFASAVISTILFLLLRLHFSTMEKNWENSLSGFFDSSIVNVMTDVVRCMREFKRYVKWRRFMGFMINIIWVLLVTIFVLMLFVGGTAISGIANFKISESEFALMGVAVFLEITWLFVYSRFRDGHTVWRDPTLQICMALNRLDRESVDPPSIAGKTDYNDVHTASMAH